MQLDDATQLARRVRALLATFETEKYGRPWNVEEIALGFVGDVGDLAKLVQAAAGVREIDDLDAKLAHELADCLWAVLVLADQLNVDLERAFSRTMTDLEEWVREARAGG